MGRVLGALVAGIALLVGAGLLLEELSLRDDADRVVHIGDVHPAPVPTLLGVGRVAALPDGSLWLACRWDRLCAIDARGAWRGSIELPRTPPAPADRHGWGSTHGIAGDGRGRVYVSHGDELLVVSTTELRVIERLRPLPEGEHPRCLAMGQGGTLWAMTSRDDLVLLDPRGGVRSRSNTPMTSREARHHGCGSLAVDAGGRIWMTPAEASAIYVFAQNGELVRRHAPAGPGEYRGLGLLEDGSVVVGHYDRLRLFGPDFAEREGPKARRDRWGWVSDVTLGPDGGLIVAGQLGHLARWDRASSRW